jgi:hypothetical protein
MSPFRASTTGLRRSPFGANVRRILPVAVALTVLAPGTAIANGASAACSFTRDDKTAVREMSAAHDVAKPAIGPLLSGTPTRSELRQVVRAASGFSAAARVSQVRADNASLKRIFGLYATGLTDFALGLQAALNGDEAAASKAMRRGNLTYGRGQDGFRALMKKCNLRLDAFG